MILSKRLTAEGDPKCRHKWVLHEHVLLCDKTTTSTQGTVIVPYASGRVHRDVLYCSRCTRTFERRTEAEDDQ